MQSATANQLFVPLFFPSPLPLLLSGEFALCAVYGTRRSSPSRRAMSRDVVRSSRIVSTTFSHFEATAFLTWPNTAQNGTVRCLAGLSVPLEWGSTKRLGLRDFDGSASSKNMRPLPYRQP
jgi:hypothetical protein